jgi:hypothetical protein
MPNAVSAFQRLEPDYLFQVAQLSLSAAKLHCAVVAVAGDGDAGGVISAIFELPQPFNNDGHNALFAYVTYDATHNFCRSTPNRYKFFSILGLSAPVAAGSARQSASPFNLSLRSKPLQILARL